MSTFYLKYRPQTILDLDLNSVREQLAHILRSTSIPHAFLFSGPRGLGKTSAARILAKAINCENQGLGVRGQDLEQRNEIRKTENTKTQKTKEPNSIFGIQDSEEKDSKNKTKAEQPNLKSSTLNLDSNSLTPNPSTLNPSPEPCNHCAACLAITNGTAIDVIEMDGASNRGIDDIRTLKEGILQRPIQLERKIYIIDEVHMLTKEAFNALLKTLEEPPEHVLFIFATTEPHKVPATILSRTFQINFTQPSPEGTKRALQRVILGEKLEVEPPVLDLIIQRTNGGFRDSHKLLEQLALGHQPITQALFEERFPQALVSQWLEAMTERDAARAFAWIQAQNQRGVDWPETLTQILNQLRDQLLSFYGLGKSEVEKLDLPATRYLIDLCLSASNQLKFSLIPTLPLELIVAEWMGERQVDSRGEAMSSPVSAEQVKVDEPKNPLGLRIQKTLEHEEILMKRAENRISKIEIEKTDQTGTISNIQFPISSLKTKNNEENDKLPVPFISIQEFSSRWDEFVKTVQSLNQSVAALLRSAAPHEISGNIIMIKVFYDFHKGRLEQEKNVGILEQALESMFGVRPKVRYILGEKDEQTQRQVDDDQNLAKMAEELFT